MSDEPVPCDACGAPDGSACHRNPGCGEPPNLSSLAVAHEHDCAHTCGCRMCLFLQVSRKAAARWTAQCYRELTSPNGLVVVGWSAGPFRMSPTSPTTQDMRARGRTP